MAVSITKTKTKTTVLLLLCYAVGGMMSALFFTSSHSHSHGHIQHSSPAVALAFALAVTSPVVSALTPVFWNGRSRSSTRSRIVVGIPYNRRHESSSSSSGDSFLFLQGESSSSSVEKGTGTDNGKAVQADAADLLMMDTIRSMRVKELKAELSERKISTADVFEKEELVKRLYNARISSTSKASSSTSTSKTRTRADQYDDDVIRGDISFTSIETGRSIPGTYNSESIRIDAEGDPYPTMTIHVVEDGNNNFYPLHLLLDTACSGLVLRPSIVQKHSNNLRLLSNPVTMTGAGGTSGLTAGLTQIDKFTFGDDFSSSQNLQLLGPLPAAVQDIGALPLSLDGIIGLSFLSQYACTELDIDHSRVAFYKTDYRPPYDEELLQVVAEGELSPTRLGIWTVDTTIDGRGPIKMLVDTGATSTFLSWKGLGGLGLSRNSPLVKELTQRTGAMGSDNVAMSLTHRIEVERSINFGRRRGRQATSSNNNKCDGLQIITSSSSSSKPLSIDIGDIAILDTQLAADNVAGILGMDVLSRFSMIRMTFNGPVPRITLFLKKPTTTTTASDISDSGISDSESDGESDISGNSNNNNNNNSSSNNDDNKNNYSNSSSTASTAAASTTAESTKGNNNNEENSTKIKEEQIPRKKKKKRRY